MDQSVQVNNTKSVPPVEPQSQQNRKPINFNPQIICIELSNNTRIYFQYEDSWTIETLIHKILSHKDYMKLYSNRTWQLTAKHHSYSLFDLHLAIYHSIKDELETKIDHKITLGTLRNLGLIKDYKYPLLNLNYVKYLKLFYDLFLFPIHL